MMLIILTNVISFTLCCLKFSAFAEELQEVKETYRAAVAEYYSIRTGDNPEDIFNQNANNYVKFIEKAWEYNADIIVFPESGLTDGRPSTDREIFPSWTSVIPDPKLKINPCVDETNVLEAVRIVSCAARNYSIYTMVNIAEKVRCQTVENSCSSDDGFLFYNTNVVFDRNGSIIARYRKYNLFGEVGFNKTEFPDLTIFETDFGVTFGVFMAFDVIFKEPSLTLVREMNVTDFVYNLHWFSALPFMTAVQTLMAWSYTLDVNLLASGYNRPISGAAGSGIFAGCRGAVVSALPQSNSNLLLLAEMPRQRKAENQSNGSFALVYNMSEIVNTVPLDSWNSTSGLTLRRDNLEPYTTMVIDPAEETHDIELCDRGLCCRFYSKTNFSASEKEEDNLVGSVYYRYRFAVFNGVRDYSGIRTGGIQTCAMFACIGDDLASCGLRLPEETPRDYIAETLTDELLLPLEAEEVFLKIEAPGDNRKSRNIEFRLLKPRNDLLTFAIYGRNFTADGSEVTTVGENSSGGCGNTRFTISGFLALVTPLIFL